jgi:cyclase
MLNRPRVIPVLTIMDEDLVKTTQFKNPRYLGDPINAVKIFNEKMVDELCVLDIGASKNGTSINFDLLETIASQAFMPLSYGGGIKSLEDVKKILKMGYEKVIINSAFSLNPKLIKEASDFAGSSSVVLSIDIKPNHSNNYLVYTESGSKKLSIDLESYVQKGIKYGCGEVLLNSIDRDGMMTGYPLELISRLVKTIEVPMIVCGGAGSIQDLSLAVNEAKVSAVAAGSLFVYYGKQKAVLINFPSEDELIQNSVYKD